MCAQYLKKYPVLMFWFVKLKAKIIYKMNNSDLIRHAKVSFNSWYLQYTLVDEHY